MIPQRLVKLGIALDLYLEEDGTKRRVGWKKPHWLCSDAKGRVLFVIPALKGAKGPVASKRTSRKFREFDGSDPTGDVRGQVRVRDEGVFRGRCTAVGYRSRKWGRKATDYQHDFDRPPRVTQYGQVYRLAGAGVDVTAAGIVG